MPNKFKKGVSLIHLMILLVTASLLLAAAAPVITRAYHKKSIVNTNQFICFWGDDSKLHQVKLKNKKILEDTDVTAKGYCSFVPSQKVKLYSLQMTGGGGGGGFVSENFSTEDYKRLTEGPEDRSLFGIGPSGESGFWYQTVKDLITGQNNSKLSVVRKCQLTYYTKSEDSASSSVPADKDAIPGTQGDMNNGLLLVASCSKGNCGSLDSAGSSSTVVHTVPCNKTYIYTLDGSDPKALADIYFDSEQGFYKGATLANDNPIGDTCPSLVPPAAINSTVQCESGNYAQDQLKINLTYDYKLIHWGNAGRAGFFSSGALRFTEPIKLYPGKGGSAATIANPNGNSGEASFIKSKDGEEKYTADGGLGGQGNKSAEYKLFLYDSDKEIKTGVAINYSGFNPGVLPDGHNTPLPTGDGGHGMGAQYYLCNSGSMTVGYNSLTNTIGDKTNACNIETDNAKTLATHTEGEKVGAEAYYQEPANGQNGIIVISW